MANQTGGFQTKGSQSYLQLSFRLDTRVSLRREIIQVLKEKPSAFGLIGLTPYEIWDAVGGHVGFGELREALQELLEQSEIVTVPGYAMDHYKTG